ncbi:MAG: alanine--tRNA ligase [Candidatus Paceibacterota bacterium]
MTSRELREKFLEFFKTKGHTIIPSASLVPENDPTVLFTTAGMHPLVPFLLGEKHPGGNKVTSCQKCIRTVDIDEVGDATHLTFFEMLGNWSFGDYFKDEAIEMSFEFLTSKEWLGLNVNLLAVSVFAGDADAPFDSEAFEKWKLLGISEKRIARLPKKNNWWGPAGETGPCGPDTEMFYWTGDPNEVPESFHDDHPLWVEIWNDVFMQYNKTKEGLFEPLQQKNVDTGMGLERVVSILNKCDVYQIDTFQPVIEKIEELSDKNYREHIKEFRIIADHIKASVFMIADGIVPSNTGQGYVLRRLIRRAVRYGKLIGITKNFIVEIAKEVIHASGGVYFELKTNENKIIEEIHLEEEKFQKTLDRGLKEFSKIVSIDGKVAFDLYQSYGFPIELIEELSRERGFVLDVNTFQEEFEKHQELSRTASAGVFKGGLADHSEITTKYHTVTHLLLAALRQLLDSEIYQKGSNITAERMRFDFNYPRKLTAEQIKQIEDLVNRKIIEDIPVEILTMPKQEALSFVKVSFDQSKYGDVVKVYKIGDFSIELCGGPHVERTSQIGTFHIVKEEAVSAGIRRIRATIL